MTQTKLTPTLIAALGLLGLIWGGSFLSIRVALDEVPVVTTVLHRTFWAMLLLWGIVWLRGISVPRQPRIWGALLVMGMLNNVIPFGLMSWGQLHIESGLTAILNATTAVFGVLVAAMVFTDERLTARRALGVGIGFVGVVVAIGADQILRFDPRNVAQLAVLGGTLSYALAGAWGRATLDLPPILAAAGMLTGATLVLAPAALIIDGPPDLSLQPATWGAIGYYSVIATALAYLLYYWILARAGAGNLLLVTLIIPPVAIVLGAWLRDEALPPNAFFGFALLGLGLWVLSPRKTTRKD
jgi:drug/metabolite transporter (DMT)-like permease